MHRLLSAILILFIAVSICIPCSDGDAAPAGGSDFTALQADKTRSSASGDNCLGDACSPFCTCACCCAAAALFPGVKVQVNPLPSLPNLFHQDMETQCLPGTGVSIWQPPRLA